MRHLSSFLILFQNAGKSQYKHKLNVGLFLVMLLKTSFSKIILNIYKET